MYRVYGIKIKGTVHWYQNHAITHYLTAYEILLNIVLQQFADFMLNESRIV